MFFLYSYPGNSLQTNGTFAFNRNRSFSFTNASFSHASVGIAAAYASSKHVTRNSPFTFKCSELLSKRCSNKRSLAILVGASDAMAPNPQSGKLKYTRSIFFFLLLLLLLLSNKPAPTSSSNLFDTSTPCATRAPESSKHSTKSFVFSSTFFSNPVHTKFPPSPFAIVTNATLKLKSPSPNTNACIAPSCGSFASFISLCFCFFFFHSDSFPLVVNVVFVSPAKFPNSFDGRFLSLRFKASDCFVPLTLCSVFRIRAARPFFAIFFSPRRSPSSERPVGQPTPKARDTNGETTSSEKKTRKGKAQKEPQMWCNTRTGQKDTEARRSSTVVRFFVCFFVVASCLASSYLSPAA